MRPKDRDLVKDLKRPGAYPHRPDRVEVKETHISWVFLAGDRAYKVKKPVRFAFLDYSTPERRRHFCEEEVRLNRRLAPDVYLGVVPVTADGRIRGEGTVLEHAVEMVRLPDEGMLDRRLREERVVRGDVERIADHLAAFHAAAPRMDGEGGAGAVVARIAANLEDARPYLPPAWRDRIAADQRTALEAQRTLLDRRAAAGRVRDGHGDLHAANVCFRDGEVVFYDCIEFDPALRCVDVAGEVSFLAMDLERYGAWDLAAAFVDRYVARSGDADVPALLPLFKRHRACVRGLVESLKETGAADGRDYFRLAASYGRGPFLLLVCGLQATGKSFLARRAGTAFGAALLRSDLVRKELCGMAPTEHWTGALDAGPYAPELTDRTYAALRDRAAAALASGRRVVADAVFGTPERRESFREAARRAGVPFLVVHVTCAEEVVRERLERRRGDASAVSDAGWEVYVAARRAFVPPAPPCIEWDGAGPAGPALDAVLDALLRAEG